MEKAITKEKLLTAIDIKSKAIINLGLQLHAITPKLEIFDIFIIAILNRTVNLNKAFVSLIRDNNFIAAAPFVRINLDSLMRLYAARISEYDFNTFAQNVLRGEHIRRMKAYNSNNKLTDAYLIEQLSQVEDMEWVKKVYEAGNSFIHFGDKIIFSSQFIANDKEQIMNQTIGLHDTFVPESEKFGAIVWMNKIIDSIIKQVQIRMYEKCKAVRLDIEKLNDINFIRTRTANLGL